MRAFGFHSDSDLLLLSAYYDKEDKVTEVDKLKKEMKQDMDKQLKTMRQELKSFKMEIIKEIKDNKAK